MTIAPQATVFQPEARVLSLGDAFYDRVAPADFPATIPRFRNDRWDKAVGLDSLDDAAWLSHFGRFKPLPGSLDTPLALRYHGHQFRVYNPDLGDGRGFLFAQLRDGTGRLLDLGTKGSGQTPWSRAGDGRLTLKGGVREVLATEMLEALGVETSKTFSLIETGEALHRGDEPSPTRSAVMVRLSHGHVRIGTFQRLAARKDGESMARLVDYVLRELYGETPGDDPAGQLIARVVPRAARLAADYMAAGFVHGVLNSDNINITLESFDYGPWRFAKNWDPAFTAAYFDHQGLYSFGRQAQAIHWDVVQLAIALRTLVEPEALVPALETFPAEFEAAFRDAVFARLGIRPRDEQADLALLAAIETALTEGAPAGGEMTLDRFFFDWRGGRLRNPGGHRYDGDAFAQFAMTIGGFESAAATDHPYWSDPAPCALHIEEVEAIWAPIAADDDWTRFDAKVAAIRRMGEAMRGGAAKTEGE
ncbi:protein adenylyltransferase SelO family protein [Sphingomonas solaris]|uniref:YdiU family protein n=1 Tax=Alterirhizorhabdus solaris TaxID=2529389 RepID=A0A558QZ87_9SPHN|nr:YdiU family protein [Sphingomonas solaris]TVV72471.1 YdiU family protein [Sphingomonas solaris]